jgi:hypothetical protein
MSPSAASAAGTVRPADPTITMLAAWLVPGAGHLLVGQWRKGVVFLVVLTGMFLIGLAFGGRLFPFQMSEPLVFLAAAAEWALGLPRLLAAMFGGGRGTVVSVTYEYGNTFLIVSGLLNLLIILDAADIARGRKGR